MPGEDGGEWGCLRDDSMTPNHICRLYTIQCQTTCVSCRIIDIPALFAGPLPELGIDFAEVRPKWLVAVGAAALLAMGRPISGSHRFPDNFHVGIPLTAGSSAKTQVRLKSPAECFDSLPWAVCWAWPGALRSLAAYLNALDVWQPWGPV